MQVRSPVAGVYTSLDRLCGGGFWQAPAPKADVSLSVTDAVELALKNNLHSIIVRESIAQAKGQKGISRLDPYLYDLLINSKDRPEPAARLILSAMEMPWGCRGDRE